MYAYWLSYHADNQEKFLFLFSKKSLQNLKDTMI